MHTDKLKTFKGGYEQFNADYSYRKYWHNFSSRTIPLQTGNKRSFKKIQNVLARGGEKGGNYSSHQQHRRTPNNSTFKDTVLLEIQENGKFYAASIYMDYNATNDIELKRIEKILTFTKGEKLLIATDSNCRSTAWHDTTTNNRGRMMEDCGKQPATYH